MSDVPRKPPLGAPPYALTKADLDALPVFPLPDVVLFPGALLPLHIFEPRYREMTRDVLAGKKLLAMAHLLPGFDTDYHGRPPVHAVCGVGTVVRAVERADGRYDIVLHGIARMRIVRELSPVEAYRMVQGEELAESELRDPAALLGWQRQLIALLDEVAARLPVEAQGLREIGRNAPGPGALADVAAATLVTDPDERQRLLEELDPTARMARMVELLHGLLASLPGESKLPVSSLS